MDGRDAKSIQSKTLTRLNPDTNFGPQRWHHTTNTSRVCEPQIHPAAKQNQKPLLPKGGVKMSNSTNVKTTLLVFLNLLTQGSRYADSFQNRIAIIDIRGNGVHFLILPQQGRHLLRTIHPSKGAPERRLLDGPSNRIRPNISLSKPLGPSRPSSNI